MKLHLHVAAFVLLAAMAAVSAPRADARELLYSSDVIAPVRQVVELTNQERVKAGLNPLKWNDSLALAAANYAQDLAVRNYFAHNSPEGSTPVSRAQQSGYAAYGWGGLYEGENLARGFPTPEGAIEGWMNSPGHRANMLNPNYREIGIGVAVASSGALVWAQEFGSRPKVLPIFINGGAMTTESQQVNLYMTSEKVSNWGSMGNIVSMMVSNSPDYSGAKWEPFATTKQWKLAGEPGSKRVYVRLRDASGTVVESTADIVLLTQRAQGVPDEKAVLGGASAALQRPQFQMGFRLLANQIPNLVGDPTAGEQASGNGDCYQPTTTGLMVWRKADNFTAYTNGDRSWINGPYGVQERANNQRLPWEKAAS